MHRVGSDTGLHVTILPPVAGVLRFLAPIFWVMVALFSTTATAQTNDDSGLPDGALEYEVEISDRLNPTGRAIQIPVPLKDGNQPLGDVVILIDVDDSISIQHTDLKTRLAGVIDDTVKSRLEGLPLSNGFVSLDTLRAASFGLHFDRGMQELVYEPAVDDRATTEVSLAGRAPPMVSEAVSEPAYFSGYLNVIAGLDYLWNAASVGGNQASARFELDSTVRVGSVVMENRALLEGDVDAFVCPSDAICDYAHRSGLKRQESRLVYDLPEQAIRIELGDTDVTPTVQQRAFEMLGFSINKSERRFRPAQSTQPTGSAEFRLDRQSTVSVLVNGTLTQQLNLRPGNYQLRDLPLVTGANAVELAITDDLGNQRSIDFASYFDTALLAAGKDEWEVAAGAQSYLSNNQRGYDTGELLASGFYRRGLTDELTGEVHIQADELGVMGGASALMQSSLGVFRLNAAASGSQFGSGASVGGAWDLINFVGITGKRGESIHIEGDYRTEDFYVPGLYVDNASGVFFPQQDYRMRVSGSYSAILKYGITASVSGRYIWANDTANLVSRNTVRGDRYGADLTLSAPLGPDLNGGITVGYSNETYLRSFEFVDSPDPEFRFGMRMFWRPDRQSNVIASHDTINDHSTVTAYRNSGTGLNRWNVSVNAHHAQSDDLVNASGAVSYYGNRGEVSVTHLSDVSNISSSSAAPRLTTQRTLVRAGSSIAFADGQVAVGPPIYGDAFAIVYPHKSLSGNDIDVTHGGTVSAKADGWGAAVVTAVPVYYPNAITVDVADLPIGYSLGAGAFDTFAPYKGGYALQVGSDNAISIYGTLVDAGGQPIELLTGSAYAVSSPSRKLTVFTNAAGRFGAEGLAPGRWAIEMATANGPTKYLIDIPDGAGDLVRVGTLSPSTHSEF